MKKYLLLAASLVMMAACSSETTEDLETPADVTRSSVAVDDNGAPQRNADGKYICNKRGEKCVFFDEWPEGWTGNELRKHNGDAFSHFHCIDPDCSWYYKYFTDETEAYNSHVNKSENSQGSTGAGHGGQGGIE